MCAVCSVAQLVMYGVCVLSSVAQLVVYGVCVLSVVLLNWWCMVCVCCL